MAGNGGRRSNSRPPSERLCHLGERSTHFLCSAGIVPAIVASHLKLPGSAARFCAPYLWEGLREGVVVVHLARAHAQI